MHPRNPVRIIARFAGKMCLSWHMDYTRSCATTRGPSTFHEIIIFVWKLRVGECLILKATPWERKKLSGSGSGSWGIHKWWGIEKIFFQKTSSWAAQVQLTLVFPCLPRFRLWLKLCVWGELRPGPSALVSGHSDCWASERRRYVVTRWGVG